MSDLTPPPNQPPQQSPPGYGEPLQQPPQKKRRGLIVGVVVGVIAAVALPLGAFALYQSLSGGGSQPDDVLPGDGALAYFRIDLDPSASQKVNALRFLDHFPSFSETTGIDNPEQDVREVIFDAIADETDCDVEFSDVDAWLGERMGMVVLAPEDEGSDPGFAAAIQVSDEDAARDGIAELAACGAASEEFGASAGGALSGSDSADDEVAGSAGSSAPLAAEPPTEEGGWAFLDGYMVVAETQELADDYAAAAQDASLADNEQFSADLERLGEPGVATVWLDGEALVEAFAGSLAGFPITDPEIAPEGDLGLTPEPDAMADQMREAAAQSFSSAAIAFRFESNHAEIASVVSGDLYEPLEDANTVDMALPETTMFAFGLADGDRYVERQWDSMLGMMTDPELSGGMDPEDMIEQLEAETGLALPEDLQTLLGSNLAFGIDSEGLEDVIASGDISALGIGARIDTDPEEFAALVDTIEGLAAENELPLEIAVQETEDGVAVAANDDYASTLAEGGSLADSDAFQAAVSDAGEAQSVFYFNFDVIEDLMLQFAEEDGASQEVVDNVQPIEAFGFSTIMHDGYAEATFRLTVNE
jgi:hypothetical protein